MAIEKWYANVYKNNQPKGCESPLYVGNAYNNKQKAKERICEEFNYLKTISFYVEIDKNETINFKSHI